MAAGAIAIIGTLDTKGPEVAHLAALIQRRGHATVIIDPGILGTPALAADVTREEVAAAGGAALADLLAAGDKGRSMATMIEGTRRILARLYAEGRVAGAIGLGGGQGTAIGAGAMQALPVTAPKLMVSTIASGRNTFGPYVGTTDMTLMHSVADIAGINSISRRIFANAAGAICGMVEAAEAEAAAESGRPAARSALGLTMLGLTTGCGLAAKDMLEAQGYEVVVFHANGAGGNCMERLIHEGLIRGVLDLSTQELTGYVCHGLFDGGPERLKAAAACGLPQVVVPGGADYIVMGPLSSLSDEQRGRPYIVHNPNITLVRASATEMAEIGSVMAQRLNAGTGPTAVLIPGRGFSQANFAGGPFYDPAADAAFVDALCATLAPGIPVETVDAHVNDLAFAQACVAKLAALMARAA